MGETTAISWCDATFNPWEGCTKVSAGCTHCYAEARNKRFADGSNWGVGAPRRRTSPSNWMQPVRWNREAEKAGVRRRVFCASLADVFDAEVAVAWRLALFDLISRTPSLDWLLLTKRPELIKEMIGAASLLSRNSRDESWLTSTWLERWDSGTPPSNVWLGTTCENQEMADLRIPELIKAPAAMRFLSCEPLLGPLDLSEWLDEDRNGFCCNIDWVIVGGESGSKARPFNVEWARSIVFQCRDAGRGDPRPFVKQLGDNPIGHNTFAHHGADPREWPEDLRVQEFPDDLYRRTR